MASPGRAAAPRFLLASDVGGTFTDTVLLDTTTGRTWVTKVPSRRRRQEECVRDGVATTMKVFTAALAEGHVEGLSAEDATDVGPVPLHHGSTVATNALLERRGAAVALLTNEGFEDLLEIRRQDRPHLYDLRVTRPEPLVPRALRLGVPLRRGHDGSDHGASRADVLARLDAFLPTLRDAGVESVAVGLLHADLHPDDEKLVSDHLREHLPGVAVCTSHEVWPEMREVERFETTVVNAYLMPLMAPYVSRLADAVGSALAPFGGVGPVRILDSAGSLVRSARAANIPGALLYSGPAGGVAAATGLGRALGRADLVTFDVGGTSTDVSLVVGGTPRRTGDSRVGGFACRFPAVDVHSLGAGGGSLLWRDAGGTLQVGPESQGAYPGPACYGRGGDRATLTDALLLAGRLPAGLPLGGRTVPDAQAAYRVLEPLAQSIRRPLEEAVLGAIDVAVAATAGGVQVVTTHRGHDPRRTSLLAFGGAGPLLGADLAATLGIQEVLVPWDAGAFSARGMCGAPVVDRRALGLALRLAGGADEDDAVSQAVAMGRTLADGEDEVPVNLHCAMRYVGQSYELDIPVAGDETAATVVARFHAAHEATFGHSFSGRAVEAVRLTVERVHQHRDPGWGVPPGAGAAMERPRGLVDETTLWLRNGEAVVERPAPVLWRPSMSPGQTLPGPLVIPDPTATTYVPPGWEATIDAGTATLILRRQEGA